MAVIMALFVMVPGRAQDVEHKIPPGYEPELAEDEKGLWMEIEKYELSLNKSALLVKGPELNNYLQSVVCRVAGEYCTDIRVYLVRNPGFNASMTATGMMQVWTGMLVRVTNTDELAAIIGHEIAHYTLLHTLERLRQLKKSAAAGAIFDMGLAIVTIGIFTGTDFGIGKLTAFMSALSFSRAQEQEADILGARLLAEAGLDPHASYRVWQQLIEEEQAAATKKREPDIFSKTHPDAEDRAEVLQDWVTEHYGSPDLEIVADDQLVDVLSNNYQLLMEDQIDTNRFGRTQEMLKRHLAMGVEPGLVYYFHGEMFRQRDDEGDRDLAIAAYRHSIETGTAPPDAYKNLGYLHLKNSNLVEARKSFRLYLHVHPDASDRAMIEYYLDEDKP